MDEFVNPYKPNSAEYYHWQEGWWAACYNEAPLFGLAGADCSAAQTVDREKVENSLLVEKMQTATLVKQMILRLCAIAGALFLAILCFELADMVS